MPARWRAAAVGLGGGVTSGGAGGTVLAFLCRMVCKNSVFVNADSSETPDNQTNRGKATQFRRFFVSGLKIQTETKPDNQTSTSSVCLVAGFAPDKAKTTQFRCFLARLSGCLVCLVVSTSGNKGRCRAGVYFCSAGRSQFDFPTASPPETAPVPLRFAVHGYS